MGMIEEAVSLPALRAAVEVAVRNRGAPGPDGVTVAQFAARADSELDALRTEVMSGVWRPRPARRVMLPKPGGGYRPVAVGCVRDRVLQHSLAGVLAARLDDRLHRFAYAWRKGKAIREALDAVEGRLAQGYSWVLRADIDQFFDRIPPAMLLAAFENAVEEPELVEVVRNVIGAGVLAGRAIEDPALGTPQGSPLSPLLANLYLVPFDTAMEAAGFTMVRYGDDFCVTVATRQQADQSREIAAAALARLRLCLNQQKVEVRHHGEGFVFLGYQFDPTGRRAGARAARQLVRKLEAVLDERPTDGGDELETILHGWLGYYGSFSGVTLPEAVRHRAESLEASRAENLQFGAASKCRASMPSHQPEPQGAGPETSRPGGAAGAVQGDSRWQHAAKILCEAIGNDAMTEVCAQLAGALGIDTSLWPGLAAALGAFDGPAAAEMLARAGRFADAAEANLIRRPLDPVESPARPAVIMPESNEEPADAAERPTLDVRQGDAERMLELFGGAEHTFARDLRVGDKIQRERIVAAPNPAHVRDHLAGAYWMGVFPLRANNSVRFAAIRVVVSKARKGPADDPARGLREAASDARRLVARARECGLEPLLSVEPERGYVVWLLLAEAVTAARARALAQMISAGAGAAPGMVTREVVPAQEVTKRDKPGTPVFLPLGLDPRTKERAWLCDEALSPQLDPCSVLRGFAPNPPTSVAGALGLRARIPIAAAVPPASQVPAESGEAQAPAAEEPVAVDPVALATSPFSATPRAQHVYAGCAVFRCFVDQAIGGHGLGNRERVWIADVAGRLGNEGEPALEAVCRHLDDYRPGMASRWLARLYPYPTSCGRLRERYPELTARVGCDCRFRVPPGAYPTPVLHAIGAAEVPGLAERVREAASRGGVARAAVAAMNEGRKELGARAAAICARIADLRRQAKVIEKTVTNLESELDRVVEEAGDTPLETPSGVLRRVEVEGCRRFVLEV